MPSTNSQSTEQAAELLKTIAHPIRLRVLLVLIEQPSINVSTLQTQLKIDQSALSHHLIKMKDRGLLNNVRRGKEIYYSLADTTFAEAVKLLLNKPMH
ncbi:ArsR/SmtB family transcription factor [Spirosoma validum]|uniref:Helix-turn-helix transcriptional regulator n=1 Tax=Spirosoma validum TaxID=2771355 RepID=A0A927B7L7_9BACT|nr:metalloregulator ArsR/SmtB family transcription factor [Spirosoma validum]MBD2757190.1 helix-turn-helix transcriptional regulator [Spirosoma validum]